MDKTKLQWWTVASLVVMLSACSSETEEIPLEVPAIEQGEVEEFLEEETEDLFNDELDQEAIINSKVNAPVDFKEWISSVEMSSIVLEKDGYTLELPSDIVVYECETANKLVLSQNIPLETDAYQIPHTLTNHSITVVRGDAGIFETKQMVYRQQLELKLLADEQHISQEELVFIHDFKEFDNKYGEIFQYTMIETMNYSAEFPTTLILILAQENGHLYFDASYENEEQKEALKSYLLELCYHVSPLGEGFLGKPDGEVGKFYQLLADGSRQTIEVSTENPVVVKDLA